MSAPPQLLDLSGPEPRRSYRDYLGGIEHPRTWEAAAEHRRRLLAHIARQPLPPLPEALPAPHPRPAGWAPSPAQLVYHAPLGLIEGAWLQGLTRTGAGERPAVAALFRGYLDLLGRDAARAPARFYRGLLARHGISPASPATDRFGAGPGTAAFALGALQLALAYGHPTDFPELLGYSLGYVLSPSPWRLAGLDGVQRQRLLQRFAGDAGEALRLLLGEDPAAAERVRQGIALYRSGEDEYLGPLAEAGRTRTLAEQVAAIFAAKASTAAPYHRSPLLAGKPLQDWFATEPFDATGFLAALSASDWIAGEPGNRPFDRLTAFGGRMFGVFSQEELASIGAWIDSGTPLPADGFGASLPGHDAAAPAPAVSAAVSAARVDRRRLFQQLLDPQTMAEALPAARRLVRLQLGATRRRTPRGPTPIPLEYSPAAFRDWLDARHRDQLRDDSPRPSRPKLSKEAYRWGILQLAPAILVDGCWLDHACLAADQGDPVKRRLLRIGADEAGAGNPDHNHPAIYRRLLESLDIELPATASPAFAASPLLLDAAFDLPAFLLAIGRLPQSFLPEILGLNLAIELSGLGRQYRRLAQDLEYWGIDPTIVRLHQSIDNLASGHAALACEAIAIHLDDIRAGLGPEAEAGQWRRIRTGYLSLESATRRFRRALLLAYLWHFLLPGALAGCVETLRQMGLWPARLRT